MAAFAGSSRCCALIQPPFAARAAVSVALIAPFGLALGTSMLIGLRRLAARIRPACPGPGNDGITSVIASVLAVAVAISFGFTVATLVALAATSGVLYALFASWPTSWR